jgi:RimJ/RimL family protein N-acetyltransferase
LIVLVRDTDGAAAKLQPAETMGLRRLGAADAVRYARAIGTDSTRTFSARLSEATRCYAVEDGDRILHASWVTTDCAWTRELRSFVCVQGGDAYVYESFTRADARGRGVYPFALVEICRTLAEQGVGRLWVAVEAHNEPSLKAVAKAGFERSFEIRYARRLGRLSLELPDEIKSDTPAGRGPKNRRIWLSRDGAIHQGER